MLDIQQQCAQYVLFPLPQRHARNAEDQVDRHVADAGILHPADRIDGLGGPDNIVSLMNCFTRLRIDLKDMSLINEDEVNKFKNSGIVRGKNNVQIIVGMKVQDVFEKVMVALGRDLE